MFNYVIYFLNYKDSDSVIFHESYKCHNDARKNLETVAMNYIKREEGDKQMSICKQNKSIIEITQDSSLRLGSYIVVFNDKVFVYEKIIKIVSGYFYNSEKYETIKVGKFGISECIVPCVTNNVPTKSSPPPKSTTIINKTFIDELKDMMNDGGMKLKPINK